MAETGIGRHGNTWRQWTISKRHGSKDEEGRRILAALEAEMDRRCPRTGGGMCEEWGSGEAIQNSGGKTHINVQQGKVYTRKKKSPEDVCNGREAARQKGGGQTRSAAQDSRKRREQIAEQWEKCKKEDDEGGCSASLVRRKGSQQQSIRKKKGKRGRQRTEHSADKASVRTWKPTAERAEGRGERGRMGPTTVGNWGLLRVLAPGAGTGYVLYCTTGQWAMGNGQNGGK
ncbi:hypothetical protein E4U59_005295 [Claviceps monticola]|nr:hypothetical protein E4U59_005295 [Claviceps monticola]